MKREIWKNVVGFEGLYEVSSVGRVRRSSDTSWYKKGWLLSSALIKGYLKIRLYRNGQGHWCSIHQLVLKAFRGPKPKGKESSHLNDIKTDNKLSNLEWMTKSQNRKLAYKNGRQSQKGKNNVMFGKEHSLEARRKMRKSQKIRRRKEKLNES